MNNLPFYYYFIFIIIFFLCSKLSYKLNLVDYPNERKVHKIPTAYTGGIAISICLLVALQEIDTFDRSLASIISISFLVSLIGVIDDKFSLNVGGKLSLQIIPIMCLIIFENLTLISLGDYNYFSLELKHFGMPFTLLCVLFLKNSFNYFDGLNGTLSSLLIFVLLILYFLVPNEIVHIYLTILIITLILFLCFNFSLLKLPRLFLGDSGSLMLGFITSFLLIYLANQEYVHPILLAWSIVIFVYEFLSINVTRLKNGQKLFKAGKDHLHHILLEKTKSLFLTNFYIILLNISIFLIGYLSFMLLNELTSMILYIILFVIYLFSRLFFQKKN